MNFCLLGRRCKKSIIFMFGDKFQTQLSSIYKNLVRFSNSNYHTKSNNSTNNGNNSFMENENKPNKKSNWLDTLNNDLKQRFELAKEFMRTKKKANAAIINKLLYSNISETDLQNLLNGPRFLFTDLNNQKEAFKVIIKEGKNFGSFSGIYIWTHISSGKKYVGSAYHLPTRLRSYFSRTHNIGKLLPLLSNFPITEFNLEVVFTPHSKDFRNEMVLEQYYLLDGSFNLNTIRVSNNPSGSNAKPLFMYNRDFSILYFSSTKQIDFINKLGIHYVTFNKHLKNETYYLGKYVFSRKFINTAQKFDISLFDLCNQLEKDRAKFNVNKPVNSLSISIVLIDDSTKEKHFFHSLGSTIQFLKDNGHKADQRTLVKRLNTDILYYGYKCYRAPIK